MVSLILIAIFTIVAVVITSVFKSLSKNEDVWSDTRKAFKTASKIVPVAYAGILVLCVIFGSFYSVSEDQQAVVTMFGKVQSTESAGVHWKVPFLQSVKKVDITTHGASIGYVIDDSSQNFTSTENPLMITSDFNLINVDFYMEYRVNDPVAFLYNTNNPEEILGNMAMSSIRGVISDYSVDDVMTTAKNEIQSKIRENIATELEKRDIGIQLVNIMIQDVEPPTSEVFNAFKSVESAKQQADTAINNAKKYQNEQLPSAEANADKILQQAEATKAARIAEAEGQVARFNKMYEEYSKYPLITKQRLFYETMEELLPKLKVYITDGSTETLLPLEPFSTTTNNVGGAN